ncbi:fibronectin type III domain-containing protein 10 [Oryzias latipes]|uniref:fibronectin type III domain-containing protein 10 n=1 Tax=Oryzias latipes TaxID=8090 RepID=UPI0002A4889D|nr:fibronectin type III domain-containing protein 10 [Oryzias latipes]XP_020557122.1 fibronectin type III domain-containing protein 10 [Oryzias latipes]
MAHRQRVSLLALSALLVCILALQTAGSHRSGSSSSSSSSSTASPEARGWIHERTAPNRLRQTSEYASESRPPHESSVSTSQDHVSSAVFGLRGPEEERVSPVCAYRVVEGGIWGQLCFRRTQFGFQCRKGDCRSNVSVGDLVANILTNGSVLLQWRSADAADGTNATTADSPAAVFGERPRRRRGFELSCWWNGSYTQFECASVHLASGCRDFLLTELHESIPYRICVRALPGPDREREGERAASRRDCVEFTLPPSGMQDIVIAMTTVGGAICVMLVIICLLVAYITENIMSPTNQLPYSYRTHSCR